MRENLSGLAWDMGLPRQNAPNQAVGFTGISWIVGQPLLDCCPAVPIAACGFGYHCVRHPNSLLTALRFVGLVKCATFGLHIRSR